MIHVDFIKDVSFHAGGFGVQYGDRLSSVMDMTFREGNRNEFDGQLDLNFAGFGAVAEGPLPNGKGSWMFAGRRSYLDMVVKALSWALRELAKREDGPVREFMEENDERLAGRVRKEVWNKLNTGKKN